MFIKLFLSLLFISLLLVVSILAINLLTPYFVNFRKEITKRERENQRQKFQNKAASFGLGKLVFGKREFSFDAFDRIDRKLSFKCLDCQNSIEFELIYYRSGYPIEDLFHPKVIIKKSDLLERKAVQKNNFKGRDILGELTLWLVSARFEVVHCSNCKKNYIIIFGMGEIQPGRELVQVSGVWELCISQ